MQVAKKAKDNQCKQQCEAGGIMFTSSLNSKMKDDLLDITFVLQLTGSDSNTTETRATLISMISVHLDNNPHLTSDSAFAGLFNSQTCGQKWNDENVPLSALPPPTLVPPGFPCQPLSSDTTGNVPELELEPPMVLFDELLHLGRFFWSINSTSHNLGLPGSSSLLFAHYPPFTHYPPPIFPLTGPQFLPPCNLGSITMSFWFSSLYIPVL